jgi:YggT family protein
VSMNNRFVSSLMLALDSILTPILRPVRRIMPPTGGIDFSPIVLLVLIKIVLIILSYLGTQFE